MNNNISTFPFPIFKPFISFSYLIVLAKMSNAILNRNVEVDIHDLVLI